MREPWRFPPSRVLGTAEEPDVRDLKKIFQEKLVVYRRGI
jgi:hypothetical protein